MVFFNCIHVVVVQFEKLFQLDIRTRQFRRLILSNINNIRIQFKILF